MSPASSSVFLGQTRAEELHANISKDFESTRKGIFPFVRLPRELRDEILIHASHNDHLTLVHGQPNVILSKSALLLTSRQLHHEYFEQVKRAWRATANRRIVLRTDDPSLVNDGGSAGLAQKLQNCLPANIRNLHIIIRKVYETPHAAMFDCTGIRRGLFIQTFDTPRYIAKALNTLYVQRLAIDVENIYPNGNLKTIRTPKDDFCKFALRLWTRLDYDGAYAAPSHGVSLFTTESWACFRKQEVNIANTDPFWPGQLCRPSREALAKHLVETRAANIVHVVAERHAKNSIIRSTMVDELDADDRTVHRGKRQGFTVVAQVPVFSPMVALGTRATITVRPFSREELEQWGEDDLQCKDTLMRIEEIVALVKDEERMVRWS